MIDNLFMLPIKDEPASCFSICWKNSEKGVINRLEIVLTDRSPSPPYQVWGRLALSPRLGGEGWGEGVYACQDKYRNFHIGLAK